MITPGPGVRIWLAAGLTDMRRGFDGLAALVGNNWARTRSAVRCSSFVAVAVIC